MELFRSFASDTFLKVKGFLTGEDASKENAATNLIQMGHILLVCGMLAAFHSWLILLGEVRIY
jgi:hypothetical protein